MARFIVCLPAGPHTRYAPDAFAGQIGKPITVNHPDGRPATGTLVDAQVGSGGTEALLTIEWEDPLDVPLCVKWAGHDGLRISCSRCWPWWYDRPKESAPRARCPDVHAHEGHGWIGGEPWTTRWCTGVQQCPPGKGEAVKVLGPLGHDIDLWIGYGDNWVLEPSRVVVHGPGVWTAVVSGWVRDAGMGAVRVRVTPEGGMPIEQYCSISGKLWRTQYDQATGAWLPRELVVEEVER